MYHRLKRLYFLKFPTIPIIKQSTKQIKILDSCLSEKKEFWVIEMKEDESKKYLWYKRMVLTMMKKLFLLLLMMMSTHRD